MLVILEKMELFNSRVLIILLISSVCVSCKGPEVNTPLGRIRGTFQKSIDGYEYSSFEGIPYAKPPVGELRFEEPVPVEPWIGIWEATRAYMCPQSDFGGDAPTEGTEDCLYLNIYVPGKTLDANKKFDINFHIHGGGFMIGSGDHMANSTFMMDHQDIIFVSINYRLNALGFLSTEDEEVPGNNGMKDQVLALKWVRDNIRYFGGNPDSITITGYSAGGASVHLHYLSPLSKGLFSRGISQSGSALNPWVIKENPLVFARRLAADVGCPISTTKELKKCLKTRPANLLVDTVRNYLEFEHQPFSPFAVVVEKQSRNAFLPEHPYFLLKKKQVADLPWITSVTRDEGILPAAYYCHNLEPINKNLIAKAHLLFDYNHTLPVHRREQFALKIRDHYFGKESEVNEENYNKLKNVFTDRLFTVGVEIAAKLQADANKSPVYFYYYNYEKANNKVSKFFCPNKDVEGVSHADDCVFAYGFFVLNEFSENDKKVRKVFQRFIQTFVNGKNPSFDENVKWLPTDSDELTYLNITDHDDIKLEKIKSLVPIGVWDEVNDIEFQITPIKTEL